MLSDTFWPSRRRDVALVALVFEKISQNQEEGYESSRRSSRRQTRRPSPHQPRRGTGGCSSPVPMALCTSSSCASRESVVSKILRLGAPPPLEQLPQSGEAEGAAAVGWVCSREVPATRPVYCSRVATSVLPPFARPDWLLHPLRFLGLEGSKADPITKIAVDDARGALYALSARGALDVYDLGREGQQLSHVGRADVSRAAKVWATAHSARDTTAPSPHLLTTSNGRIGRSSTSTSCPPLKVRRCMRSVWTTRASGSTFPPSLESTMTASSSTLSEDSLRPRALVLVHVRAPPPITSGTRRGNGYWLLP